MAAKEYGVCSRRGCENKGTKLCMQCAEVAYCSKECQKIDWKGGHKEACRAATKPEIVSLTNNFEDLSIGQLKNLLITKAGSYNENKRQITLKKMEQRQNDKSQLLKLVSENVKPDEVEALLSNTSGSSIDNKNGSGSANGGNSNVSDVGGSNSNMTKKERQRAEKAKAALENKNLPSADMLRKQARQMSRNPELVRKANPQFRNMSDAEIREQARQMEMMAGDPQMLKTAMQMSTLPTEDRTAIQKIQEGLQGQRPRDEAWIDETIRVVKAKPDILKTMFSGRINPASGLTEEQVLGFIDYVASCSDWFLKNAIQVINWGVEVSGPVTAAYNKVDEATLGCAKYIVMAIAFFLLYHLARLFYFIITLIIGGVMSGYRMITATASPNVSAGTGIGGAAPQGRGKNSKEEFDEF